MDTTSTQERVPTGATSLERDQWQSHPHFPTHALLLDSHDNFLRVSKYLVEEAFEGESARSIGALYRRWIAAMRSHEAYEEAKLYPFLERRWRVSADEAKSGHRELHGAHDAVMSALAGIESSTDGRADDTLRLALVRHDRVLVDHLVLEEDMVIPLLLALEPEEFAEYYHHPIWVLLDRLEERAQNAEENHGTAR